MQDKKDRSLDIPSEANREKHINFLAAEERTSDRQSWDDRHSAQSDDDNRRREEWQKGLEEGDNSRRREQ